MEGTADKVEQERRRGMTTEQDSGSGLVSSILVQSEWIDHTFTLRRNSFTEGVLT